MSKRNSARQDAVRRTLALEAARIISEQGVRDYHQAKTKAARRLGIDPDAGLPKNTEVEAALRETQLLFGGAAHQQHLQTLREAALQGMAFFSEFRPRLVGPVLEGTADSHSAICLQIFAELAEHFALFLEERNIPYDQQERTLRMAPRRQESVPVFLFTAGGHPFDVSVLSPQALRQAPLSPVTGRPMRRASPHQVRELLEKA